MASKKSGVIEMLEVQFNKLPALPRNIQDGIVTASPWFALVFGLIGSLAFLTGLSIIGVLSPVLALGGGIGIDTNGLVSVMLILTSSILMLLAVKHLFKRRMQGWKLLFWSLVIWFILSGISLFGSFDLKKILFSLIGIYLLFQVKSRYK